MRAKQISKAEKRPRLLIQHLENISWRVLEEYRDVVADLIRRKPGVYVLYRTRRPYYVGLAKNLMHRINTHLKDRHNGAWDRFSVYLTGDAEHIKELESLLLRIVEPKGNRQSGRFPRAENLLRLMNRRMTVLDADRRAKLLGGAVAKRRLRNNVRRGRTASAFAGLSERRIPLRARYKGRLYRASLRKDGTIGVSGKVFPSPTAAAKTIVGRPVNGLWFWKFRNDSGKWVNLKSLRR